jgi:uncharacterized protein YecA (UPF0149 family)
MLMEMFGVENYMIVVAKKWVEENIDNESWIVMIWEGENLWQMHRGGDYRGKMQSSYSHITHLEFVDKVLEENDVHQPHEKQWNNYEKTHNILESFLFYYLHLMFLMHHHRHTWLSKSIGKKKKVMALVVLRSHSNN